MAKEKWAVYDVEGQAWLADDEGVAVWRERADAVAEAARATEVFGYGDGRAVVRRVVVRWVGNEGKWIRWVRDVEPVQ